MHKAQLSKIQYSFVSLFSHMQIVGVPMGRFIYVEFIIFIRLLSRVVPIFAKMEQNYRKKKNYEIPERHLNLCKYIDKRIRHM